MNNRMTIANQTVFFNSDEKRFTSDSSLARIRQLPYNVQSKIVHFYGAQWTIAQLDEAIEANI